MFYFLKQFLFHPSTCVGFTSYTTCSTSPFVSAMCLMFSLFHTVFSEEHCNLLCSGTDCRVTAPTYTLQSGVWGSSGRVSSAGVREDDHVAEKDRRNTAVSYCRFPSLHTCIIQFNIFPFYGPKYSWMIRSSGRTCSKLGESVETCFLRRVFRPELFSSPSSALIRSISPRGRTPAYCVMLHHHR